jgi:hypothetical protein
MPRQLLKIWGKILHILGLYNKSPLIQNFLLVRINSECFRGALGCTMVQHMTMNL